MQLESVSKKISNISSADGFQFIFHCDRCGTGVKSEKYEFITSKFDPPPKGRARDFLWTRQHDEAFERAKNESQYDFNYCPVCGRWVCNKCFHISSDADTDICVDCWQALKYPAWRKLLSSRRPCSK